MLFSLLLTGLLTAQTSDPTGLAGPRATALELARTGHDEEALEAFLRIVAANPRDHHARLWIARLHARMGHADRAELTYRSVMLENEYSVEAKLGLADALVTLHRYDEAVDVLDRAERQDPDNPDVLAALGRAHRVAGNTSRSLVYLRRAVLRAPTAHNRLQLEETRRAYDHRVESTSFFESFDEAVPDTRSTDMTANLRVTDRLRVLGRGQVQRKFGVSEQRGGAGVEWRWMPRTTLAGHVLVGPGNDVLPRTDLAAEVGHVEGAAEWTVGVRYFDFTGAGVSVVSPAATWWATGRLSIGLRYSLAVTRFEALDVLEAGHTAALRASVLIYPRVWLNGGYTKGVENFDTFSPDQLGDFRADTATGGIRIDLPTLTSIVGQYEYQWRSGDTQMNRFTIGLAQRF